MRDSIRLRTVTAGAGVSVHVIERMSVRTWRCGSAGWLVASMVPLAVVVAGPHGLQALDARGRPLAEEKLAELAAAGGFGKRLFSAAHADPRMGP